VLDALEDRLGLAAGALKIELMVETTQSIFDPSGRSMLPRLRRAAGGRLTGAHFGTYDYTAGCDITAAHQRMRHPACDFAKHMMKVAFAGTGVMLSDGATNIMPVGPHRGAASPTTQQRENRAAVFAAWRLARRRRPPLARPRLLPGLGSPPRAAARCATAPSTASSSTASPRRPSGCATSSTRPRRRRSSATCSTTPPPARACSTTSCAAAGLCGAVKIMAARRANG
jgi:hypothetical protein